MTMTLTENYRPHILGMGKTISLEKISQNKITDCFSSTHSMLRSSRFCAVFTELPFPRARVAAILFSGILDAIPDTVLSSAFYLGPSIRILSFCTYGHLFAWTLTHTRSFQRQAVSLHENCNFWCNWYLSTWVHFYCAIPDAHHTSQCTGTVLVLIPTSTSVQECWTWNGKWWNQTTSRA